MADDAVWNALEPRAQEDVALEPGHHEYLKTFLVYCCCRTGLCLPHPPNSWSMHQQEALVDRFSKEHTGPGHEIIWTNYQNVK